MRQDQIRDLKALTDLAHRRDVAALQPILGQEAELRAALARLDAQESQTRGDPGQLALMRPMGADVLWQAWLARNRRDLNGRLAEILSRKEAHLARLRKSFGRAQAANDLNARSEALTRGKMTQRALDKMIADACRPVN